VFIRVVEIPAFLLLDNLFLEIDRLVAKDYFEFLLIDFILFYGFYFESTFKLKLEIDEVCYLL